MKKLQTKPEIMAPAGSFEALQAAINAGADSIFFGVHQLNMRARAAQHFTLDDLKEIAKRTKKAKVRTYLTLNTLLYQHDLSLMKKIVDSAKINGINAVIVQDMAAIQYCQKVGMPVHCSTQLSISNYETVKFYAQFADTMVLARELDLNQIKYICSQIKKEKLRGPAGELVKIEVFVHGAMCVAQSGRCHMSVLQTNTSAQRGACLQECRKKYRIIDDETGHELVMDNHYVMSPKDMCALPFLDKVIETGVAVLKIEGRGRSADYVDKVVRAYREAVDLIAEGKFSKTFVAQKMEELKTIYNRGFCDGYFYGKTFPDWCGAYGSLATEEKIYAGLVTHYFPRPKVVEIDVRAHKLTVGDRLVIMGKTTGVIYAQIAEIVRDHKNIKESKAADLVTVPIAETVRQNDKIYILKKRFSNENS
jgi:U32 family peptidase